MYVGLGSVVKCLVHKPEGLGVDPQHPVLVLFVPCVKAAVPQCWGATGQLV